jgi:translation initiation factor IF-2
MSESTQAEKRINSVAKEFNVSVTHLIEALNKTGFTDVRPTSKISVEMYTALLKEFQQDKADKQKADKINLARNPVVTIQTKEEVKQTIIAPKKEEKEVLIKDVTAKIFTTPEKTPEVVPIKEEGIEETKTANKIGDSAEDTIAEKTSKTKAPQLKGPKIVGKIDIASPPTKETAAKKTKSKKTVEETEKVEEAPLPEPTTVIEPKAELIPEVQSETEPVKEDEKNEVTRKTSYETLSGPKIMGKVDLKSIVNKPADYSDIIKNNQDKKKPRKRIYTSDGKTPAAQQPGTASPPRTGSPYQPRTGSPNQGTGQQGNNSQGPRRPYDNTRKPNDNRRPFDKNRPPLNRDAPPQSQEITEKQVQDKIKETMARLSGGGPQRNKGTKADYRRAKRRENEADLDPNELESRETIHLTEFVSVAELASLLDVAVVEVIKKCMSLGIIVSINQRLDAEIIELVANELGKDVSFISMEQQADEDIQEDEVDETLLLPRAPIVTIMGHVDHGKTSLLDYIRETNVVAGEKGGITQHIGAYEVTKGDKKIAFLDTPGHEAFTAMRARGAKITDIAVVVIAADDSVMPQTKEAISHAQAAGVPIIFAFNKMDKPGANADNIRQQLASQNILVEEWGGKFQTQEISAKTGLNVDLLLEKILLETDILDLKANPNKVATGSVIEATLDKGRGFVATLLVQDGSMEVGDVLVAGSNFGRIKAMYNERGHRVQQAGPSTPVQVLGLDGAPQAGEKFKSFHDEQEAKQLANKRAQIIREQGIRTKKHITLDEIGRRLALGNFKELNIIIKADFDGSVEALTDSLLKLSTPEIQINIVYKGVGQISESDVLLATASDAIIIGFQVRPSASARKIAEKENIEIKLYSIIYDAINEIKGAMEGMLEPKIEEKIVCNIEVREVFKIPKVGSVAGCFVTEGKMTRNTKLHVIRDGIVIYGGELSSLKRYKDDAKEVTSSMECGLTIKNFNDIKVGDIVEGYEEVEVKRTL